MRWNFSEIFRKGRGGHFLWSQKFLGSLELRKNIRVKFSQIWSGGPPSQGVGKSPKKLRWVDRDCRAVYKTEQIVDLWYADRRIIDVEILPN